MTNTTKHITVLGERPSSANHEIKITGPEGTVEFKHNVQLIGATKIRFRKGGGHLIIGENVQLRGFFDIGGGSTITIGTASRINRHCKFITREGTEITLGKRCLLSNATLRTCDMHSILDMDGKRINPSKNIRLGNRVWLAENTYISKGVRIGSNSVVAANSIVTKSIPSHSIAAGNPAKVVKSGISWRRRRIDPSPST